MRLSRELPGFIDWSGMSRHSPLRPYSGFALTEALVALLLLAFAMLGAGAALVGSLAGQRTALLQTRAADFAGNLAEALRSTTDSTTAAAEIQAWQIAIQRELPQARATAVARDPSPPDAASSVLPARLDIRVLWRNPQQRTPAQLMLPLGFSAATGTSP
jgi:type II secretory pathway pseudopilin PulG